MAEGVAAKTSISKGLVLNVCIYRCQWGPIFDSPQEILLLEDGDGDISSWECKKEKKTILRQIKEDGDGDVSSWECKKGKKKFSDR
jgi:hypothetical protein